MISYQQYGSQISDEALLGKLDACASLAPKERAVVVAAMARFVELGKLPQKQRDWCMAIAKAKKLFRSTEAKPRKDKPLAVDGGDCFSTRRTAGTAFAEKLLARPLPKRPPGRAA